MARYTITNPPMSLELDDEVVFTVNGRDYRHTVRNEGRGLHLSYRDGCNGTLFEALGLDKLAVCREAYGYDEERGAWPETRGADYGALTRLVWKLFGIIAALPESEPKAYTIDNRPTCLKVDDKLIFVVDGQKMKHHVTDRRLAYFDGRDSAIFDKLGVDKVSFCREAFGYEPMPLCFLEPREGDMDALTRLANAIFDKLAKPAQRRPVVGDKVRALEGCGYRGIVGQVGVIVQDDCSNIPFYVKFDGGSSLWFHEHQVELVDPTHEADPPFGWVKFTTEYFGVREHGLVANKPYPVTEDHATIGRGGQRCDWSEHDSLAQGRAIRCDRDGNPIASFKVGDKVRVKASVERPKAGWGSVKHGHVTEIYVEQDGDDVNICARRNGTTQVIAYIRPDMDEGGKGRLHLCGSALLDRLQLVEDEDGEGMIALAD